MPNTDLSDLIEDLATFSARYKSLPLADKPASCTIPEFDSRIVDLEIGTPPVIEKECLVDFVPPPIFPIPYIPIEDISTPCPEGFTFESRTVGTGTIGIADSGGSPGLIVTGTGTAFTAQIPSDATMPEIGVDIPTTVTEITVTDGGNDYDTAPTVTIGAPNPGGIQATATAILSSGVVASVKITNAGYGYSTAPSVTFDSGSALATAEVGVTHTKRRVSEVVNDEQLQLQRAFPITIATGTSFVINRMVITADVARDTEGSFTFYEFGPGDEHEGCGGYFIGDINIATDDLDVNIPCPDGMTFTGGTTITFEGVEDGPKVVAIDINSTDRCNPIIGLTPTVITIPPIPVVPCDGSSPEGVGGSSVSVTRNNIDGTSTSLNVGVSVDNTDPCAPIINLTGGPIVIPPCPDGISTTGAAAELTYKEWNYDTEVLDTKTIQFGMAQDACSLDIERLDLNEIVVPGIVMAGDLTNYFDFTTDINLGSITYNLDLKYVTGGDITNSYLYQAIRDALADDDEFSPCNGCSVWS